MYIPKADRSLGEEEWRAFVQTQGFAQLVAPGADLEYPVVVPTQFVLDGAEVFAHFQAANPVIAALQANPRAVLSVAGDWAFVPSDWKVVPGEDPCLGIPTTYYAAVQLRGKATILSRPPDVAAVLRRQLEGLQPNVAVSDPQQAHAPQLKTIRAVVLAVEEVLAKFKYGGNVDDEHRHVVVEHLLTRGAPGDAAAAGHAERRANARGAGPAGRYSSPEKRSQAD